jgi:RHS repeat-associated protein
MWTWHYDGLLNEFTGRNSKHVYLGESRIVTKISRADNGGSTAEERIKQYYYHSDHLGSAQVISNADGQEYERIEYTPYGELWIEKASTASNIDIPYRFTGKERDEETGLYYYGARYLDSKASRWLSTDPALGDYIPGAPVDDEARKRNQSLPGMGGVFNLVNLHLYHYAGNNPVKYVDPDGRSDNPAKFAQVYNNYTVGLIKAPFHVIGAALGNFIGQARNFLSNIGKGNAKPALSMDAKFKLPGDLINGTATYSTDGGLSFSTSVDSIADLAGSLMDVAGSPVTISAGGVDLTVGVASVGIEKKGDTATVSLKLTSKNILKGIDISMGISISASTQDGPFGTIKNRNGFAGEQARQADYLLGSCHFKDSLLND